LVKTRQAIAVLATIDCDKAVGGLTENFNRQADTLAQALQYVPVSELAELAFPAVGNIASWTKTPHGGKITDIVVAEMARRTEKMSTNISLRTMRPSGARYTSAPGTS
jgi:hypothetical protein